MEDKIFTLADWLLLSGLAFNIVGTFLLAFSITFPHKTRIYFEENGKKAYVEGKLAKFEKGLFLSGVYTLSAGFIFQLISIFFRINS